MCDEERWQVIRRDALASHNTQVRNNGRDDVILYYPGSGVDILHALFAAGAKARYSIFVDPADLDRSLPEKIREEHSRLNGTEARNILSNLAIRSQAAAAWMFSMQRRTRYLFHFRMGHDAFIAANRGFVCDVVFEKDFWETPDEIDLAEVLAILRVGGHYSTNASLGALSTALPLVGLDYVNRNQINGWQYLYQRSAAMHLTWNNLKAALTGSLRVIQQMIVDDNSALYFDGPHNRQAMANALTQNQAAILLPSRTRASTCRRR